MLVALLSALVSPVVLGAALRVQSDTACPSAREVSENVQAIVELSEESAAELHATLRPDGDGLELELSDGDTSLAERRIDGAADCAVLAHAAAAVLAAWLSNEHPEFLLTLPGPASANDAPTAPSSAAGSSQAPAPAPPTSAGVKAPPAEAPPAPGASTPLAPRLGTHRLWLGAGIGGNLSGAAFVPGGELDLTWEPNQTGSGLLLSASWLSAHSEPLAEGTLRWTRWPLIAGPFLRLSGRGASVELEAGPAVGWLHVEGQNFSPNSKLGAVTLGGQAAVRIAPERARFGPFLMAVPMLWFGRSTAAVRLPKGQLAAKDLPRFELFLAAGVHLPW